MDIGASKVKEETGLIHHLDPPLEFFFKYIPFNLKLESKL